MRQPLRLEALERRDLPSVSQLWLGNSLLLVGNSDSNNNVLVRPGAQIGTVDVVANGLTSTYANPAQVLFSNGTTNDTFVNRTTISTSVALGSGSNTVNVAAPGSSFLITGSGNNIIQDTAGGSRFLDFGSGNNNIYGGPSDQISVGSGVNIVYDILGTNSITVAPHTGVDHLFVSASSTLTGAMPQDHVAQFFAPGRTVGSGTLALAGNTLYFTADNSGDLFFATPALGGTLVFYTTAAGQQNAFFPAGSFNQIAVFGGAGNDVFINNTSTDDVMYGAGGNNTLLGGFGQLDLEKAGGAAGTSLAIGRSPVANDLNGSSVQGVATTLVGAANARNIFRTNSTADLLVGRKRGDSVVTLLSDQIS